jgi:hypothetical protein
MGNNQAFSFFEQTVIGAYDLDRLDKPLLAVLMKPYRDVDIDSGGKMGLTTKDGKGIDQVVIETWGLTFPKRTKPDNERDDEYDDEVYELFSKVTDHFGWS